MFGIAQFVGHEIDTLDHAAAVDPFLARVPAFHRRRVQQILVHVPAFQCRVHHARAGEFQVAHQVQRADHDLSGALDPGKPRRFRLEEIGREHRPQHGPNVVTRPEIFGLQNGDSFGIRRRRTLPRGNLHVVRHEEVVHVPADEPRRGRLAADYLDDVVAVEVAGLSQEGLFAVVVVVWIVTKQPRRLTERDAGHVVIIDGPTSERPGRLLHVILGVVLLAVHPDAHGEQFQQLPAPVLVDGVLVVEVVVQPENHRRIAGQPFQQWPEAAQSVLPKQVDLVQHGLFVQHLRQTGGENSMPEQRDLFLQRPRSGVAVHAENRFGERAFDVAAFLPVDVVPLDDVLIQARLSLRVQQPFHGGVVSPRTVLVQFRRRGAEARAPQQVGDQRPVITLGVIRVGVAANHRHQNSLEFASTAPSALLNRSVLWQIIPQAPDRSAAEPCSDPGASSQIRRGVLPLTTPCGRRTMLRPRSSRTLTFLAHCHPRSGFEVPSFSAYDSRACTRWIRG